jgi:hypothetical protein
LPAIVKTDLECFLILFIDEIENILKVANKSNFYKILKTFKAIIILIENAG